jgi:hypothetical protein
LVVAVLVAENTNDVLFPDVIEKATRYGAVLEIWRKLIKALHAS